MTGTGSDKQTDSPRVHGPTSVAKLVAKVSRVAFKTRSPAASQIVADWEAIVGPRLSQSTVPRGLVRGVLTIGCAGPVAMELQYLHAQLLDRINNHVGGGAVKQLKFMQIAPTVPIRPSKPALSDVGRAEADAAVSSVADGELRDALAALGRAVIAEARVSTTPARRR